MVLIQASQVLEMNYPQIMKHYINTLKVTKTADYSSALIGKWHLGGASPNPNHPNIHGIDYYAGHLRGSIQNYENWQLTINGETTTSTTYHTTAITNLLID